MQTNLEKYRKDIDNLIHRGELLYHMMVFECYPEEKDKFKKRNKGTFDEIAKAIPSFGEEYQIWYSEALEVVRQILPSRMGDFVSFYRPESKRKEITFANYTIEDYLQGLVVTRGLEKATVVDKTAAIGRFRQQLKVVESMKKRFESSLFDIKTLVQADLFDDELEAAYALNNKGFVRGAGAIAGVVLESHLLQICENHKLKVSKKSPTINDLSQLLKDNGVVETPIWRFVQHLADLRNLCDHNKKRDPEKEEIEELIAGVQKTIKTVY